LSSQEKINEKELLSLVAAGDEAAFEQLLIRYGPLLKANAMKVLKAEAAAEDVVQDVFLRVWISRDRLTDVQQPQAWLLQITYYQCFNVLRHEKVRREANARLEAGEDVVKDFLPTVFDPEQQTLFAETKRLLQTAVSELSPRARQIYRLQREEGMKIQEIARALGISTQTVKNILYRALKEIRDNLEKQGHIIPLCLLSLWLI
jgi:RNA polymerase sigma-70 factor (ECF subfamily)